MTITKSDYTNPALYTEELCRRVEDIEYEKEDFSQLSRRQQIARVGMQGLKISGGVVVFPDPQRRRGEMSTDVTTRVNGLARLAYNEVIGRRYYFTTSSDRGSGIAPKVERGDGNPSSVGSAEKIGFIRRFIIKRRIQNAAIKNFMVERDAELEELYAALDELEP